LLFLFAYFAVIVVFVFVLHFIATAREALLLFLWIF